MRALECGDDGPRFRRADRQFGQALEDLAQLAKVALLLGPRERRAAWPWRDVNRHTDSGHARLCATVGVTGLCPATEQDVGDALGRYRVELGQALNLIESLDSFLVLQKRLGEGGHDTGAAAFWQGGKPVGSWGVFDDECRGDRLVAAGALLGHYPLLLVNRIVDRHVTAGDSGPVIFRGVLGFDEPRLGGNGQREFPLGQVAAGFVQQRADDLLEAAQVFTARGKVSAAHIALHIGLHELNQFQPRATFAKLLAHPLVGSGLGQFSDKREASFDAVEPLGIVLGGCDQFFIGPPRGGQVRRTRLAAPQLVQQVGAHLERPVLVALRDEFQRNSGLGFVGQRLEQLCDALAAVRLVATELADAGLELLGQARQVRLAHAAQQVGQRGDVGLVGLGRG